MRTAMIQEEFRSNNPWIEGGRGVRSGKKQ